MKGLATRLREGREGSAGKRCRGDDGAALVEFAITAPILITLLFGIIDFGFVFNDYISVRQGARDGVRQAIVDPTPNGTWNCTLQGGTGTLTTEATDMICYTKARVGLNANDTRVKITFCDSTSRPGCPTSGTAPGYKSGFPVKICVMYKTGSVTGFFTFAFQNTVLATDVESLIETDDAHNTFTSPYAEDPLPGKTWDTSCDQL